MARPFLSNCRRSRETARRLRHALIPLLLMLAGCVSHPDGKPMFERWPDQSTATPYLLTLREYLSGDAGEQAAYRDRLRMAAEQGGKDALLEYALALSVDRDDRASLELARSHFETLLASPDPLPVGLDALVRLQLGQVIDRLGRMTEVKDFRDAYRAAATGQQMCFGRLADTEARLEKMRLELSDVRRKLDALAKIEQTVNDSQESQRVRREPPAAAEDDGDTDGGDDNREEDNDAERQSNPARR